MAVAVARGRVEVSVQASLADGRDARRSWPRAPWWPRSSAPCGTLQAEFGLEGGVSVADVVRFPGALERVEGPAELAAGGRAARSLGLLEQALGGARRDAAGRGRAAASRARASSSTRSRGRGRAHRGALRRSRGSRGRRRSSSACGPSRASSASTTRRLYQEVVRAVERHDVAEEVQRLRSHVAMARELLAADGAPAGKRLDFLAQELMREANTVGSKVADAAADPARSWT